LAGRANSGKDYLAEHLLVEEFNFVPVSLATWFKVEGVLFEDLPREEVFGPEPYSEETRRWMQLRGTENGRQKHGQYVWCRALGCKIQQMADTGVDRFVVTDVRFPNEIDWIRGLGGKVFNIIGRGGAQSEDAQEHKSERALDGYEDYDAIIDNSPEREDQVFEDLRRYVQVVLHDVQN
jgi:hypothetical protein